MSQQHALCMQAARAASPLPIIQPAFCSILPGRSCLTTWLPVIRLLLMPCRMLEAAMLGVPYAGRIPNFAAEASAAETMSSPQAQAGRVVRQEQDAAYEESLRVGICQVFGHLAAAVFP